MSSSSPGPAFASDAVSLGVTVGLLVFSVLWLLRQATSGRSGHHRHPLLAGLIEAAGGARDQAPRPTDRVVEGPGRRLAFAACLSVLLGVSALHLAGPVAGVVAAASGVWIPFARERGGRRKRRERLDEQFAEYAEAIAMAVRGGLSIRHAMEFAAEETEEPLAGVLHRVLVDHRLGSWLDRVIAGLVEELPTNETRLLTVVLQLHARTGGNLADSLDGVASAIRDRMTARRDLHVLSAQGRMSGAILALLPLAFFVVLSAASRADMSPVLRSPAGIALVSSGLTLQGLGYVWIRRLLRVRL